MPKKLKPTARRSASPATPDPLLAEVRRLILAAREHVSQAVNAGLVLLYWKVGDRVHREVLDQERAGYGEQILQTLSAKLTEEFGRGFSARNLASMVRFAEVFPDESVVASLCRVLSWSHLTRIIYLDDPLKRDFYAEMCRVERWSVRTLNAKVDGLLFERTAIAKQPADVIEADLRQLRDEDRLSPDLVFRDTYVLDFLGLQGAYSEKDLEAAILRELETFLIELGGDFAFLARQKRITLDGDDFYIDLLFYHRGLRRLVVIDLKLGKFAPADLGQMELYLRWLNKHDVRPGEEAPLGLILCAGKSDERIEVLELETRGIRVAEYLTELLPKEQLQRKLHEVVASARARLANRPNSSKPEA